MVRGVAILSVFGLVFFVGCGLDEVGLEISTHALDDDAGAPVGVPSASNDGAVAPSTGLGDDAGTGSVEAGPGVSDAAAPIDAWAGGKDAGNPGDADAGPTPPAPPPPDAGCPGVMCNGQCAPTDDCAACAGAPLLCGATGVCTSDCTACPGLPIGCFACDSARLHPVGTCVVQNVADFCLNGDYPSGPYLDAGTALHCSCTSNRDCPGSSEVCGPAGSGGGNWCMTCGEPGSDALLCKSGATCFAQQARCQTP